MMSCIKYLFIQLDSTPQYKCRKAEKADKQSSYLFYTYVHAIKLQQVIFLLIILCNKSNGLAQKANIMFLNKKCLDNFIALPYFSVIQVMWCCHMTKSAN